MSRRPVVAPAARRFTVTAATVDPERPRWAIWDAQCGDYLERETTSTTTGRAIRFFASLAAAEREATRLERARAKKEK